MADDHYSRPPRPNNPFARPNPGHAAGGDPLAELARLIGQSGNDPYTGYGQGASSGAPARDPHYPHDAGAEWRGEADPYQPPHDPHARQPGYQNGYDAPAAYNPSAPYQDPSYPAAQAPAYGDPNYTDPNYTDPHYSDPHYSGGTYPDDAVYRDQQYAPQAYAPQTYGDPQYAAPAQGDPRYADPQHGAPQFASPQYDDKPYPAYDNQLYARQGQAFPAAPHGDPYGQPLQAANGQGYPGAPYDDPNAQGYGGYYQQDAAPESDERPARRRGGLVTVLAVLALAVVGTAAAFGYRAVFTSSGTRLPPPVIKADTAPSKIVPAANDSAKPIQDRVGDRAQLERLITREEQPVDVNTARAAAPRVVFPGPNPIAPLPNSPIPQSPTASAPAGASAAATSASSSTEPKKIRTVTIRSDQPDLAATARVAAAVPSSVARAPVQSGVLPEDDQQARSRPQVVAPAASSSGPLSLSPNASAPAQRAAPMRTAAVPAAPVNGAGGYSVQVTSQRSEGEAQSAYAALQSRFPSELGNRQAVIRRADLGDKGVYYRAQVPFGSQSEAADFCISFRNAGGQCVVHRN